MKTYYKNDLQKTYLILEGREGEKEDYQIAMLKENDIPRIIKTDVRYIDNQSHYYYDISGKTSFKALYERAHLGAEEVRRLVASLLQAIQNLQEYMLEGNNLLLEPEYIFCSGEEVFFCYYPSCQKEAKEEFHKLTEFFVREMNYKDEEGVRLAYTLHKATMEDNYSIEQIMKSLFMEQEEEAVQTDYVEILEQHVMDEEFVAEKNDLWEPVRRLLDRFRTKEDLL